MTDPQRRVIAWACATIAGVLGLFYFLRPLWAWATWDRTRGTLDLGFLKVTSRPPFPDDARTVVVGVILPIVLVAVARLLPRRPTG